MKTIPVRLKESPYPIQLGVSLSHLGKTLKLLPKIPEKTLIMTHPNLDALYGKTILKSLKQQGIKGKIVFIPEGEKSKNLQMVHNLYRICIREKLDRTSAIIALGGGVIGDIAGYVSATYLRGIPLIQVPTTLLAMVDSSIGGKVGVDLPEAKNSIGAFFHPKVVWIDFSTLKTLPEKEFRNGLAEVIKYGIIKDKNLFMLLEKMIDSPKLNHYLPEIIGRCAKIKADVVSKDEKETKGLREILNFGHTVGHAIETITHYRRYKHGEAISVGMCAAGFISNILRLWERKDLMRMESLIARAGLPTRLPSNLPQDKILRVLFRDKKVQKGELRFVLPVKIGKVIVKEISPEIALKSFRYIHPL